MTRHGLGWRDLNALVDRATEWPLREIVAALVAVLATVAWTLVLYLLG